MDASIAIPLRPRKIAWTMAVIAVATRAVCFPILGVPLAFGVATYALIRVCKPHQIVRGRTFSPRQHQRAAVIAAGGMAGIAALSSGTLVAGALAGLPRASTSRRAHNISQPWRAEPRADSPRKPKP